MKNYGINISPVENFQFLSGGGEMGMLMRSKDWSDTSLGTPDTWPQSLRTTLSIILNSKFPMFLWWSPELICFYNDAYRPSLGENGKHPHILGMRAEEAWVEIWNIIKPLIVQVLAGGEATWSEDQLIPIYRNGKIEDVYWTFSYSPVNDESGEPAGVFVTCNETTSKVNILKELKESKTQLQFAIEATELGTWDLDPITNKFTGNDRLKEWFGLMPEEHIDLPIAINVIAETDRQRVTDTIQKALQFSSGGYYEIDYSIIHPLTKKERIVRAKGKARFNDEHIAYCFDGTLQDITTQVMAKRKTEEANERLRLAAEAAELATWELNLKTRNIIYSSRLSEIFGHGSSYNFTHLQMRSQIHPDDLHGIVEKAFDIALETGIYKYEARFVKPNNQIRWIRTRGKVFYNDKKEPVKLIGTLRDITEEKYHEIELLESEQKFRLLADSMPQHIWTADTEGNLNYFNESVFSFSGLTPEQITKDGWIQIVHHDEREENIKKWMHSVTTGEDFLFEHRFRRYDGEYRWQLSRAIPQKDSKGKIQMWVGTSTDIQEMKEQEQQKDFFISMASHELKTPITSIKGYVQLLQIMYNNSEDDILKKSLGSVEKQVEKLTHLIADLLDLSKIKSGNLFLNREQFLMNELILEVVDEIRHINPGYRIVFSRVTKTSVFADRERVGQVLTNLLTNAIKYSPDCREVKVESFIENNNVVVSVEDSGIGINKKDQQKIFERFYRVEGKNEKTFPGFGIGLFISMEIIHRHNGDIGVKSEPGKGSVFYFSIPVKS